MFSKIKKFNAQMNKVEKGAYYFVLLSLAASFIYILIQIIISPSSRENEQVKIKSDYILTALQCLGALVIMNLPIFLEYKFTLDVPSCMSVAFVIFLYCSVYLGEVRSFYYRIPHWDTVLHAFSGAMFGAASFSVLSLLAKKDSIKLSPSLVAVFAFCFAVAIGVIWEIYEYTWDKIGDLNMQKYMDEAGNAYYGCAALDDTMEDLIVDAIGAAAMSAIGFLSIKFDKKWIEKFIVKKKADGEAEEITDEEKISTPEEITGEARTD